ncbi:MAG: ATP-dependent helicase [Eggerthellaceae bacterium]|nr:ATP-dependent helicase [Eggerthellaceae bacterium]
MAGSVMEQIVVCLDSKKNFLLSGGAGSGKTYTLIQTLHHIFEHNPKVRVACITFTNVAADEIKERSPYSKLHVSTIHDFLWDIIKGFQKNLAQIVIELIKNGGLSYSSETPTDELAFNNIEYQNYRDLENGIFTHDDLLKIANAMFAKYPLLAKILCDKFDYIFIDEYQDTQDPVVGIFLSHIKLQAQGRLCIGFFGDRMQSIYDTGVGNIDAFVANGDVQEIIKEDNYRCATTVITLLNNIRSDIEQKAAKTNSDGEILNKTGSAILVHSSEDFDLDSFKKNPLVDGWDFDDPKRTKVLFLTHRLIAKRIGFSDLLQAFSPTDRLIGNEPDKLASHLLRIGEILYFFEQRKYASVIGSIQKTIKTNADKKAIGTVLTGILSGAPQTIEAVINTLDQERLLRKDERLEYYIVKHGEIFEKVKVLPLSQLRAYFDYYNELSAYSTQHGIKGAEFDNVLVIMENGGWNKYNFKYYFENTPDKETIIARTERIFYVCCSRARENLIIYYPSPTSQTISQVKRMFGDANVLPL